MTQQQVNFYRVHFINPGTGMIGHTYEFFAADDAEAIKFATVWIEHAPMVLWGRKGLVKSWDSTKDR